MSITFEEKQAEALAQTTPRAPAFRLTVEADGLAVLEFDTPGEKVNKYSRPVMLELDRMLDSLA
ncbi:MAG TPA: hypothetical protein VMN04_07100, partial [Thermoanaerobaculia bacterium]|nr:hypothetical protein [Thermoanaerobaculia bacterium]